MTDNPHPVNLWDASSWHHTKSTGWGRLASHKV